MRRCMYWCFSALVVGLSSMVAAGAADGYAMYVWSEGFDATVPGCDEAKLLAWDEAANPECYTHNWEMPASRQWLWDTVNRPGREVGRVFVSDVKGRLEDAYAVDDCSDPDVLLIKQMIFEGHCKAPDTDIHALFATSDVAVSEQDHVKYVVWYNDTCAANEYERFDGIAVNNEAWNDVKCTTAAAEQAYLDDLQTIADEAALQVNGTLATHYSIGWRWSFCDSVEVAVDWDGTVQPATYHMIDIFDSVDVQVATVNPVTVGARALPAGYAHAMAVPKPFYVLSFTNESMPCTTTHFPAPCSTGSDPARTDAFLMESIFDAYAANGIPEAIGGIHFFRGVYSTGAHVDWPSYSSGVVTPCAVVAFSGLVELTDDAVIAWPPQVDTTLYDVARADGSRFDTGCKDLGPSPDTHVVDQEQPDPGGLFFYLVRIRAPNLSDWGRMSSGETRTGACL